jgi:hypothetical protein
VSLPTINDPGQNNALIGLARGGMVRLARDPRAKAKKAVPAKKASVPAKKAAPVRKAGSAVTTVKRAVAPAKRVKR